MLKVRADHRSPCVDVAYTVSYTEDFFLQQSLFDIRYSQYATAAPFGVFPRRTCEGHLRGWPPNRPPRIV